MEPDKITYRGRLVEQLTRGELLGIVEMVAKWAEVKELTQLRPGRLSGSDPKMSAKFWRDVPKP